MKKRSIETKRSRFYHTDHDFAYREETQSWHRRMQARWECYFHGWCIRGIDLKDEQQARLASFCSDRFVRNGQV